nr:PREDICTED: adhesion G protein-coupled receptor E2-like [Latimeria chalumnae]|eukprot:XP_014348150.1 PREDICTED: adhesion G protein-coupled receptor E2-like [Latimeria chalumnae]
MLYKSHCYYFSDIGDKKTWDEAKTECSKSDSHLVIISNVCEHEFLRNQFQKNKICSWIGLSDKYKNRTWYWVDDRQLNSNETYWKEAEPNNQDNSEFCVESYDTGCWNDLNCSNKIQYVCEKRLPCGCPLDTLNKVIGNLSKIFTQGVSGSLNADPSERDFYLVAEFSKKVDGLCRQVQEDWKKVPLAEIAHSMDDLLSKCSKNTSVNQEERHRAFTLLLQTVESAVLAGTLFSSKGNRAETTPDIVYSRLELCLQTCSSFRSCLPCTQLFIAEKRAAVLISYAEVKLSADADVIIDKGGKTANKAEEKLQVISPIVTAALSVNNTQSLNEMIVLTFHHRQPRPVKEERLCVYWKTVENASFWSPAGCNKSKQSSRHTVCKCNHLTTFAVLSACSAVMSHSLFQLDY